MRKSLEVEVNAPMDAAWAEYAMMRKSLDQKNKTVREAEVL